MRTSQRMARTLRDLDLDRPDAARVHDYFLGGSVNWAIDRVLGERLAAAVPFLKVGALANREFLVRALRYCLRSGITQFLDLGSGVATAAAVPEAASELDIPARYVYVDRDPVAAAHAQVLLEDRAPGSGAVLHEDPWEAKEVWNAAMLAGALDPERPIGLLMVSVLQYIDPQDEVADMVKTYRRLLPHGSALILSHVTTDSVPERERSQFHEGVKIYRAAGNPVYPRAIRDIRAYFGDFDLVEPGLVGLSQWHLDEETSPATALLARHPSSCCFLGGVGIKR